MSINESRNCECQEEKMVWECNEKLGEERTINCEQKNEMLDQIRCIEFAITEVALYLDTHPNDQKALCMHRRYCKEIKELKDKYQKVYGPLTINYPCNKWRWIEEPWPWERREF